MEPIIFLIWFLLVSGVPVALIVAAYIALVDGVDRARIFVSVFFASLVHAACFALTVLPMFILIYAGAHTDPVGQVLSTSGRILFICIEILYGIIAFCFCTYLAGRQRPWPLRIPLR